MKKFILILIFLCCISVSFASVSITTSESAYNLGDDIRSYVKSSYDTDIEGVLKATIHCGNYSILFYAKPISLKGSNETSSNTISSIPANNQMLGNCNILASIETYKGEDIMNQNSESFIVTTELNIIVDRSTENALPGDDLILDISVFSKSGGPRESDIQVEFESKTIPFSSKDSATATIDIPTNILSGKHDVMVKADDKFGNHGEVPLSFDVTPVPTRIENSISGDKFMPNDKITITPTIYDQADYPIDTKANIKIINPGKIEILTDSINSGSEVIYEFKNEDMPGLYTVETSIKEILKQDYLTVVEVIKISAKLDGEIATITNIGNVLYDKKESIILEGNGKRYPISKHIKLTPGESINIDLTKEVPSGTYEVSFPQGTLETEEATLSGIEINDDRSLVKKVGMGVKSITGAYVGTGVVSSRPYIASIMSIVIILAVVVFYARSTLKRWLGRE